MATDWIVFVARVEIGADLLIDLCAWIALTLIATLLVLTKWGYRKHWIFRMMAYRWVPLMGHRWAWVMPVVFGGILFGLSAVLAILIVRNHFI